MPAPGTYKFTVKSAEQAASLIREKLGHDARVLSVRTIAPAGWRKWLVTPSLEVVAQLDEQVGLRNGVEAGRTVPGEPWRGTALSVDGANGPAGTPRPAFRETTSAAAVADSPNLVSLLRRSGLTETALDRLRAQANLNDLDTLPLHRALAETSRLLRRQVETRPPRTPLSRAAFIGTAGSGRTTALCKWLSSEVFCRGRVGHVVSVEFDQPNALGPLPVFSEAIGVPLAHFPCETQPALTGGFVYFDLPAMSARRPADNRTMGAWLDREGIEERVLVLNAAYDRACLRDAYAAGRDLGATHLVFTHLDEVAQWGKLWDFLFDEDVEPLFLGTGPSLTSDYEESVADEIVRHTLPEEQSESES